MKFNDSPWPEKEWPQDELLEFENVGRLQERMEYLITQEPLYKARWDAIRNIKGVSHEAAIHLMLTFLFTGEQTHAHMRQKLRGITPLEAGIDKFKWAYHASRDKKLFETQYLQKPISFEVRAPMCHGEIMNIHKNAGDPLYFTCDKCPEKVVADHRHLIPKREAFEDYRFGALQLTGPEADMIEAVQEGKGWKGIGTSLGWFDDQDKPKAKNRELQEFMAKAERLGIKLPWSIDS
jgi:hypothetical protein